MLYNIQNWKKEAYFMKTKYIDLKNNNDYSILKDVGTLIKNGGLVVFPTETVYGIGANGLDEVAVSKIYEAKGRSSDNPLILHISNLDMLNSIAKNISLIEQKLIDAFFPGPFTLILDKTSIVPNIVTASLDTVAVRMPSNVIARNLIDYAGVPIAAPSANISGKPSGTNVEDIMDELSGKVDYIINGGSCNIGIESTVVRVIDDIPTILRPGKITVEDILKVAGKVSIDSHIFENCDEGDVVLSPGMKYKHYAPNTKCVMVYSQDNNKLISKINAIASNNTNCLIISTSENISNYNAKYVLDIGSKFNLDEISKNIFSVLRKVDSYNTDLVIIEGIKKDGLGLAIMNRLIRACGYNYIEC